MTLPKFSKHHARTLGLLCTALLLATQSVAGESASKTGKISRGRYLVSTSGCMDCHTPLKMGQNGPEPDMQRFMSGHPETMDLPAPPSLPPGPWMTVASATNTAWAGPWGVSYTSNITPDRETGIGSWSAADFKATIRNARHLGRGRPILPPMPVAAYNNLSDGDLEAMFAYLQSIPPIKNRVPAPLSPAATPQ